MHTKNPSDPQQRCDTGIRGTGFDLLVCGSGEAGCQEDRLLGAIIAEASHSDAVADGAALAKQPGVVIGQVGHVTNALPKIIISQPGIPGIIGS